MTPEQQHQLSVTLQNEGIRDGGVGERPTYLQKVQEIAESAEVLEIQHTPYQRDLLQLHEQCRKGTMHITILQEIVLQMCLKYETNSKAILADLFAC